MTTRETIGGQLGLRELAMLHRPAHHAPLADAVRNVRAALAATRAVDVAQLTGQHFERLARCAEILNDVADELAQLQARIERGHE